ncbi:hypothetical protein H8K35_09315 [Undibacterium sp. LX40W]|uniref:Uncharacterized protein n=1 Tax=Undibacterium nitidum TaxID=2762298 RepID=A0A923HP93_9BURK|nr:MULTISPECIES: hypothetical protein [Undibacterium]MBC3881363.1 hypothetical protein [Undibacterium nitidum]MBC3891854.1 hypothetical protein [Undibacterium sp. LX40W]
MQAASAGITPFQLWFTWSTVFSKTAKGREEVIRRVAGLNVRERSVLIMLDGIKRLDRLLTAMPEEELGRIVDRLAKKELIQVSAVDEQVPEAVCDATIAAFHQQEATLSTVKPAFLEDQEKLREVKDFMTSTAHTYLGLLSADLIHRIERAKDAPQLMAVVGQWYIALRDSKHGHRFASGFMEKTLATLRGDAHLSLSVATED